MTASEATPPLNQGYKLPDGQEIQCDTGQGRFK